MALKPKLKLAKADEASAVHEYGKIASMAKSPQMKSMMTNIQADEKGHHAKLAGALKGLKAVKPK